MELYKATILLTPVSKKNSQQIVTNAKTKRPIIIPSKKYKEYENDSAYFLRRPKEPISCRVNVKGIFYMPTHRRVDALNLQEALDDVLVKHGVLADDNCEIVVSHDGSRVMYDKENPRTEVVIEEVQ